MELPTLNEINEMSVRQINAYFRDIDDSHSWPVCGKFNVTERAIRKLRKLRHDGLCVEGGYEYYCALERMCCEIVSNIK